MPGNDDGSVEIRISGSVDPSVAASAEAAKAAIADLTAGQTNWFNAIRAGQASLAEVTALYGKSADAQLNLAAISKALTAQELADNADRTASTEAVVTNEMGSLQSLMAQERAALISYATGKAEEVAAAKAAAAEKLAAEESAYASMAALEKAGQISYQVQKAQEVATAKEAAAEKAAAEASEYASMLALEKAAQISYKVEKDQEVAIAKEAAAAKVAADRSAAAASAEADALAVRRTKLLASTSPLVAAEQQLAKATAEANALAAAGVITSEEEAAAVAAATAAYEAKTVAVAEDAAVTLNSRAAYEATVLVHEAMTGRFSRMAGSSLILTQQLAGQAATTSALTAIMSPLGLAIIGVTAAAVVSTVAMAQFAEAQEKAEATTIGLGAAVGLQTSVLQELGQVASEESNQTVAAATSSAEAYEAAGVQSGSAIEHLSALTQTYADITQQKFAPAQAEIAKTMKDLADGAGVTNDKLNLLDSTQRENIDTLSREGDAVDAQTQYLIALENRTDEAKAAGVGLGNEWQNDTVLLGKFWEMLVQANQQLAIFASFGFDSDIKARAKAAQDAANGTAQTQAKFNQISGAGEKAWEATPEGQLVKHREELVGSLNASIAALTVDRAAYGEHSQAVQRDGEAINSYFKQIAELDVPVDKEKKAPKPHKGRQSTQDPVQVEMQAYTDEWQHYADKKVEIDGNVDEDLLAQEIAFWQKKVAAAAVGTNEWYALVEKRNPLLVQAYDNDARVIEEGVAQEIEAHRRATEQEKKFVDEAVRYVETSMQREETAHKKAAQAAMQAWKEANSEILSAENELVSGVLSGRESLGQLLQKIAISTASKEIEADIRYWTERKLLQAEGIAVENSKEEGGFILHLLTEQKKTAATAQGATARATVENSGFFAQMITKLAALLGIHIATEKTKTAATVTAAAARAGASGVASFAEAPWPIDIGAPEFGASMAAAASSFGSLATLAVGTNYVPRDMVAQIHEGEGVIPAADNKAMREAVARGTGGGVATIDLSGDTHIHTSTPDGPAILSALSDHRSKLADMIDGAVRSGWSSKNASPWK